MVKDALRGYVALASGVTEVTAARARAAARVLVEQGEVTAGQVTALAEDLVATSRRNREGLVLIIRHEIETALRRLGLGPVGDLDALTQRVRRLEQSLRDVERGRGTADARGGPAGASERASSAKTPAAQRSTAQNSTAKKSTAKKSTAKKSTAKKSTAKKSTAKKSAAKKSTAKKSTARQSSPRRSSRPATGRRS